MCARRFLIVIFALTLLVVAAAFGIYQWGGNILLKQAIPKGHFHASAAGGGPDYSLAGSWVARPGMANDPSHWLPEGLTAANPGDAAVFYIHPTTYLDRDRWNAPIDTVGPPSSAPICSCKARPAPSLAPGRCGRRAIARPLTVLSC